MSMDEGREPEKPGTPTHAINDTKRAGKPVSAGSGTEPTVTDLPPDVPQPMPDVGSSGEPWAAGDEADMPADLPTHDVRSTGTPPSGPTSDFAREAAPGAASTTTQPAKSGLAGSAEPQSHLSEPGVQTGAPSTLETARESSTRPAITSKGPVTREPIEPSGPMEDLIDRVKDAGRRVKDTISDAVTSDQDEPPSPKKPRA